MGLRGKSVSILLSLVLAVNFVLFKTLPAADAGVYRPLQTPAVGDNAVNELGAVFASFTAGQLHEGDTVIFRLPSGFIWTTAELQSGWEAASAFRQTASEWNAAVFTADSAIYGGANYIRVPRRYNGVDNGLFKGATPVLNIESTSENEVKVEIVEEPAPGQDCFLYIYLNRIYVKSGYRGFVTLAIDAPPGSGFSGGGAESGKVVGRGTHPDNKIECKNVPKVYAGAQEQKIGEIMITEAVAGSVADGRTLTLQLPAGAKWTKLDTDSDGNLRIEPVSSSGDSGRIAEFKFIGTSENASTLELDDLEVFLEPGITGDLKVKAGGTAGLSGELTVAEIEKPVAVFSVGDVKYSMNGTDRIMDIAPYLKEGKVYLPVRFVAEALGVDKNDITWSQNLQTVEIKRGERAIRFTVGSDIAYINNTALKMDVVSEIDEPGRVMVSQNWVAEALGVDVQWDSVARKVYLYVK
ncbi:MAG TPA: copper amine oxidase N-terminal domain-containing protein [Bacillota bacterium]|nr:copper amine oxidase N-terminal domain-containing protein [Bacillota bacterium]